MFTTYNALKKTNTLEKSLSPIGHKYAPIYHPILVGGFRFNEAVQNNRRVYIKIDFLLLIYASGAGHPNTATLHKLIGLFANWEVYKLENECVEIGQRTGCFVAGWLKGVKGEPTRAYCTYCSKTLHAHRLSLLKHTCTIRHQKAAQIHGNPVQHHMVTI